MRFDGEETFRCPRRVLHPDEGNLSGLDRLLWLYGRYKSKMLPEMGGLSDQPGKLIEQFRVIDNAVAHCEELDRQKREQESRKASRASQAGGKRK